MVPFFMVVYMLEDERMRTMLLSFKPTVYDRLISGEKIYEHRRTFPDEPIKAYLYISKPVQAITGILYLDNRIELQSWKDKYSEDEEAIARINNYMKKNKYAMEIKRFRETNYISLERIKEVFPNFVIPQMYIYTQGTPLERFLEKELVPTGKTIEHSFEAITSNMICRG